MRTEAEASELGSGSGLRLLVSLEVDVDLAGRRQTRASRWDQLLSILNERIDGLVLRPVFCLRGIVDGFLQIHALAAEHDGAERDALFFLVQIGNDERRLKVPIRPVSSSRARNLINICRAAA
jgi:hypothetical protein